MKRIPASLVAACAVGSLASVGTPSALASPQHSMANNPKVTLTYWSGFTGGDEATYVALVGMFNKTHPDITVTMVVQPWDSIAQKLPTAMASGSGPDIATPDYNVGTIRQYITNGLIAPIDGLLGNGPTQAPARVFPTAVRSAFTVNGHLYAAPANFATLELYYNKTLFAKAGIAAPPKTMA